MTQAPETRIIIRNLLFLGYGVEDVRVKARVRYGHIIAALGDDPRFAGHRRIAERYLAEVQARRWARRTA